MKVFYNLPPLLLLLPRTLALPLISANNAEVDQHQSLQDKHELEDRAYDERAPTIVSNADVHDFELSEREVSTGKDASGDSEPDCIPPPHAKVSHHHQPNKQKVGGGVTNSNQTNSPAHAQSNSTVMPAVAPQPMANASPGQSPPNYGGPAHQDLPPRQLAGRSASPAPVPDDGKPKYCAPHPKKLANHTHVNHTHVNHAHVNHAHVNHTQVHNNVPNYRPAGLGSVTPAMGHGPVVPGQPWTPPPPGPERVHGQGNGQGNAGENNGNHDGGYNGPTKRQSDGQGNGQGNNGTGNGQGNGQGSGQGSGQGNSQGNGQNATGVGVQIGPDDGNAHGSAFLGQQQSDGQNGPAPQQQPPNIPPSGGNMTGTPTSPAPQQPPAAPDQQPPPAPTPGAPQQQPPNTSPSGGNMTGTLPNQQQHPKHRGSTSPPSHHNSTMHHSKTEIVEVVGNGLKKITVTSMGTNGASMQSSKTLKMLGSPLSPPGSAPGTSGVGSFDLGADGSVVLKIGKRDAKEVGEGEVEDKRERRRRRSVEPSHRNKGQADTLSSSAEQRRHVASLISAGNSIELDSLITDAERKIQAHEARRAVKAERKLQQLLDEDEMKFSHSIQFNAVPDWSSHYISYSNLKKLIYTLEKNINQPSAPPTRDVEASPLLPGSAGDVDTAFTRALDAELEKICTFYQVKELEIYGEVTALLKEEAEYQAEQEGLDSEQTDGPPGSRGMNRNGRARQGSIFRNFGFGRPRRTSMLSASIDEADEDGDSDDDADERAALNKGRGVKQRSKTVDLTASGDLDDMRSSSEWPTSRRRASQAYEDYSDHAFSALYDSGITLKKRTISLYVSLCELKSFIQLNKTGFSKALKKFDKILNRDLKNWYIEQRVAKAYPFQKSTIQRLDENIAKIEKAYADVVTKGDIPTAKRELRMHLREHVVWERNTVWREMIGIERKAQAANLGLRRTLLGGDHDPSKARLQGDDTDDLGMKELVTPVGRFVCPKWLFSSTFFALIGILAVFVVLLVVPIMEKPEQQNCLAMLVFVSLLWATEVIPLFVTSLLIPFLAVVLQVVRSDQKPHNRLNPHDATRYVFAAMWTPVIMLLLGGFTIAAALSKYHIAKLMATFVLSKAGTRPRTVLLTNMFVAMIASMWISNVAAPVLCFSLIQPMLRNLPSESRFTKALILGIALASNIGGAASPIASPQNIIALQNMKPEPSWGAWFFVALPVCIISILLIWVLLLITFQPGKGTTIVPIRHMKDRFTGVQWFISAVTLATIALWCVTHQLEGVFGDMGVVAIIPMALFFGTGILTKEDFNNFLWTIIVLAAGGLSLGKAVSSSGLLHTIAGTITDRVQGMNLYSVLLVFAALILLVATFISHTVAALIILPLVQSVGAAMPEPHPNLLVMGSALMCSAAMGLPTSGFPNMTAVMMEDPQTGQRYLRVRHFLSRGIPASIMTFAVVVSVGYGLMLVAGF